MNWVRLSLMIGACDWNDRSPVNRRSNDMNYMYEAASRHKSERLKNSSKLIFEPLRFMSTIIKFCYLSHIMADATKVFAIRHLNFNKSNNRLIFVAHLCHDIVTGNNWIWIIVHTIMFVKSCCKFVISNNIVDVACSPHHHDAGCSRWSGMNKVIQID